MDQGVLTQDWNRFNRHRFDTHSAWLDMEMRKKMRAGGATHHGFCEPRATAPPRQEKTMTIVEPNFTSGKMCKKVYDMNTMGVYATDTTRTDPYHYPNHMEVHEHMHYEDRRQRSAHTDPGQKKAEAPRPIDRDLKDAVSDEMVFDRLRAMRAEKLVDIDPESLAVLTDKNIRPTAQHLKDLNVDMSCFVLPSRERKGEDRGSPTSEHAASHHGASHPLDHRPAAGAGAKGSKAPQGPTGRWDWAVPRGRPVTPENIAGAERNLFKAKSTSSLLSGRSMLGGGRAAPNTTSNTHFHGVTWDARQQRTFGLGTQSLRMRGGRSALDGFAGTAPSNQSRPGVR